MEKMFSLKYFLILFHVTIIFGADADTKLVTVGVATAAHEPETLSPANLINRNETAIIPPTSTTTTSSTTTTTTTERPSTTTTPSPTTSSEAPMTSTTSQPSTTFAPKTEDWIVDVNGVICIIAVMDIKMELKLNSSKEFSVKVPKEAKANGTCGENGQSLELYWDKYHLSLHFTANDTIKKYYLDSIAAEIKTGNTSTLLSEKNITMFETSMGHSYSCPYSNPLKVAENNDTLQFSFSKIQLEAFKTDNSTTFSNVYACPPDTPDIVPIVVGCALTVLVVVVLIAYLVGRRRTQARGYLSM